MRNIRRSVALALAAIMMMAMNMVSFAADTAPAETEAVESVTRSTNGESVLLDKVYFACDGKNTISSREPIPATALDIENRILGSMEYFYDGLDSSGRPQYTVKASMTSNPLKLKSSKLVTRAEGVNSWHTNEEDHNGYTGTNSRSYVYTTPNPPSNLAIVESSLLSALRAFNASFTSSLVKWLSSSSVRLSRCSKNE